MTAQHLNFPQAPRNRTVAYSGLLAFPGVEPLTQLAIHSKALEFQLRTAAPTSRASLSRLCSALSAPGWNDGTYPGLCDELEPYLQGAGPEDEGGEAAKAQAEFAVYSRAVGRHTSFAAMDEGAFIGVLLNLHRRLGTGINALRNGPVGLRPDKAGNRVLFPHHRLCRPLLHSLHRFLARHLADHPGLCATVAFAAIVHAHPFNDGNGRTARTLYNLILAEAAATRHFVPTHVFAVRRPGFGIKLKRALHGGDWLSLQTFFTDAARLSQKLQAEEAQDRKTEVERAATITPEAKERENETVDGS